MFSLIVPQMLAYNSFYVKPIYRIIYSAHQKSAILRQPVIFILHSITTPCPIKFNSYACSNNLI